MKRSLVVYILLSILIGIMACKTDESPAPDTHNEEIIGNNSDSTNAVKNGLKIRIGAKTFKATLLDNPTVKAFKSKLPLTVDMSDLNDNEKLYRFPANLPTNSSVPGAINTGDLMIYGSNTLVLFYKSFPTIYSYTRLGHMDDASGLAAAVGMGNIKVTFELE